MQGNIILRYGIIPLNLPTDCDGCGKKFSVPHALLFPKGGLVLERHNAAAEELGVLAAWDLNPSYISYEPKINSRTVQGERNYGCHFYLVNKKSSSDTNMHNGSILSIYGILKNVIFSEEEA